MIMLSRRIQYFAYFFFFVGICFYSYSYFSNLWYQVDFTEELKDSFVETKYYTEGLISACWFGDCVSLGYILPHKTLKTAFVARVLMIVAFWILVICFCITIYKLNFTPDWWKSKLFLGIVGGLEIFAGSLMCLATFYYLYFHDLNRVVGGFHYGCYTAWLAGAMFITYGLFAFVSVSSVVLPIHIGSKYTLHEKSQEKKYITTSSAANHSTTMDVFSTIKSFPRLSRIFFS